MKKIKIGDLVDLLEKTANATHCGDNEEMIAGNPKLELQRAQDVKNLEDALFDILKNMGVKYERNFQHIYEHLL